MLLSIAATVLAAAASGDAFTPKARPYDVAHYRIETRLSNEGAFDNSVALRLTPRAALPTIELDAYGLKIQEVVLEGSGPVPFEQKDDAARRTGTLTVRPKQPLPAGKEVTLRIRYSGKASRSAHRGLFMVQSERPELLPYFATHFEPTGARQFYPCNDEPDDKATSEVIAVVDARYQALSNGVKQEDTELTEGGQKLRRVRWLQDKPHSTYLVALAVGQYEQVKVPSEVPATLHVLPGTAPLAQVARDATAHALKTEAEWVGVKFPWAKYDQVMVPHFMYGGMENTSLVINRERRLMLEDKDALLGRDNIFGLVAHELAHQWFGDSVTCQWWDDTWLNEGFATYMTWVALEAFYGKDKVAVNRAAETFGRYFREEDGPRSHPLAGRYGAAPEDLFDGTSYVKGANVLLMLQRWVGTETFRKGLKHYLEKRALGTATSHDFFQAIAETAGKDLGAFEKSWLTQRGFPILNPSTQWDGKALRITVAQRANHADVKGPFTFKLLIVVHRQTAPAYHRELELVMDRAQVETSIPLPAPPEWIDWNQGQQALARVESSALPEEQWIRAATNDPDPVWRMLALIELLRPLGRPGAAESKDPSPAAMAAVAQVLSSDPSPYVRTAALHRLARVPRRRLPAALGPAVLALANEPAQPPAAPLGAAGTRRAALDVLGRFELPEAVQYLKQGIARPDQPLDFMGGFALGLARVGDAQALAALKAALPVQRARGYAYAKDMFQAFAAFEGPEGLPVLRELLAEARGDYEMANLMVAGLRDSTFKQSPEAARFIADFVLQEQGFGDEMKQRVLRVLDEVRTPAARQALAEVAQQAPSEYLRASARQALEKNFPASGRR